MRNGDCEGKRTESEHCEWFANSQSVVCSVFAGFVPRVLWITLGGAIFFGTYDLVTQQLQQHNQIAAQPSG